MISKNNALGVIEIIPKRMAVTVMESRGGGVNLVSILLVSKTLAANRLGSRYGLSVG